MDINIQHENHQNNAPPSDKLAFSNRVPLTDVPLHYGTVLHIAALPSDKKIDTKLVHQLLGVGTHSPEKIADEINATVTASITSDHGQHYQLKKKLSLPPR